MRGAAQVELDLALRLSCNDRVKELLERKDQPATGGVDARMPFICVAAASDNAEGLGLLLAKGADANAQDQYGNTPLHLAVLFQVHPLSHA